MSDTPLTNMHTEPVAIVGTVLSAIAAVCVAVVPVCVSNGWTVAASIVSAVGVGASGVALTLGKRALTDSPATREAQIGVPVPVIPARVPVLGDPPAENIASHDALDVDLG
jgi:hypothetical protein